MYKKVEQYLLPTCSEPPCEADFCILPLSSCLYIQDPAEAPSSELRLDLFGGGQ